MIAEWQGKRFNLTEMSKGDLRFLSAELVGYVRTNMTGMSAVQKNAQFELSIVRKEVDLELLRRQRAEEQEAHRGARRTAALTAIDKDILRLETAIEAMHTQAENALLKQERRERNIAASNTRDRAVFNAFKALVRAELGQDRTRALLEQATATVDASERFDPVSEVPPSHGSGGEDEEGAGCAS